MIRTLRIIDADGITRHTDSDIELGEITESDYEINGKDDPLSAKVLIKHDLHLKYRSTSEEPIATKVYTNSEMSGDLDNYYLKEHLKVELNGEIFHEQTWKNTIPRIFT